MTNQHLRLLLPLALAACAVKVNGKSYTPGSSGASSPSAPASSGSSGNASAAAAADTANNDSGASAQAAGQCIEMYDDHEGHVGIQSSPAVPWVAVASDRPVAVARRSLPFVAGPACTAARDHCLSNCAWFPFEPRKAGEPQRTHPMLYSGEDSILNAATLYRTVPATKRMLSKGAIVVALDEMLQFPPPGSESHRWLIGEVERVDWKAGQLYLVGSNDPSWISSARVAVLSYRTGGPIEIVGGRDRDDLAVRNDELFLPPGNVAQTSDPSSQVKNGQPIVVVDRQPFADVQGGCTPNRDHCLRPWAWLVDNGSGYAYAGRFDGKTFQGLKAVDEYERIDGIAAAYRTVSATRANLKVGAQVFWGGGTEKAAHTNRWDTGKVTRIRDDGKVDIERSSGKDTIPLVDLRIPVLVWYPGEKVEAFP